MAADSSTHDNDIEDAMDGGVGAHRRRTDGRLRAAMLADGQQRFPWWLPLPGIAVAATWAAYMSATGGGALLDTLLWPGAPIFVATTVTTYFGWRLDLD
jgi:hypothetical protein